MIGCSKTNREIQQTKFNILSKRNLDHLVLRWRPLLKQNIYLYSKHTAFEQKKPKLESKCNPGLALMPLNLPRTQTSLFDVRAKEGGKETCRLYPSHGPLRFITSHSRFALASAMRKTKRLRRRLPLNNYDRKIKEN